MKIQAAVSAAIVLAVIVTASIVKRDRDEAKANEAFKASVLKGEEAYARSCGACHMVYDPRFFVYDEWASVINASGCPAIKVELGPADGASIKDFLRAKAAPTAEEAENVRRRERKVFSSESVARGRNFYAGLCASCHKHSFFPKTRTSREWQDVVREIGFFHASVPEPVWVDEKSTNDLLAYLSSVAGGTPSDAWAFRNLVAGGTSSRAPGEVPGGTGDGSLAEAGAEIMWERDFEKAAAKAKEKGLPLMADFTDLSGG